MQSVSRRIEEKYHIIIAHLKERNINNSWIKMKKKTIITRLKLLEVQ